MEEKHSLEHVHVSGKKQRIVEEILAHLPFSIFFTAAGLIFAGILFYIGTVTMPVDIHDDELVQVHDHHEGEHAGESCCDKPAMPVNPYMKPASGMLFHLFHPIHLMLSAIATTAMFRRHEKKLIKAVIVGFIGSVGVCGLSDIFMPYLSGQILGISGMHFHWCLIEHPQMVLPFVFMGIFGGIIAADRIGQSTKFSHSSHIFVSVVASLFYLISYGVENWMAEGVFPFVFIIVILCVTIPCCLSDIVFPIMSADCSHSGCCEDI